jgi:hypothetical protein
MRIDKTPSKAAITNKTRPARSFSSSKPGEAGRLAGLVFYVHVFSLVQPFATCQIYLTAHMHPPPFQRPSADNII